MKFLFLLSSVIVTLQPVYADFWNLPQSISTENATVSFEVDSTWHLVKGTAKNVEGKLWLENNQDFGSLRGEVRLPVAQFDTDSESRDERMREVMSEEQFPDVKFSITNFDASRCAPHILLDAQPCSSVISGDLTIHGLSKRVILNTVIEKRGEDFLVTGTTTVRWSDFNVEDPSILVAKLHEEVKITVAVTLRERK